MISSLILVLSKYKPVLNRTWRLGSKRTSGKSLFVFLISIEAINFISLRLVMKLLLACTDEKPPSRDVNVVEIREWLLKRPYTTLALQHYPGTDRKYNIADLNHESGFTALALIVTAQRFEELKVFCNVEDVGRNYPEYNASVLECKDPDGTSVLVKVSYELQRHKDTSVLLILGEWQCPKDDTS